MIVGLFSCLLFDGFGIRFESSLGVKMIMAWVVVLLRLRKTCYGSKLLQQRWGTGFLVFVQALGMMGSLTTEQGGLVS